MRRKTPPKPLSSFITTPRRHPSPKASLIAAPTILFVGIALLTFGGVVAQDGVIAAMLAPYNFGTMLVCLCLGAGLSFGSFVWLVYLFTSKRLPIWLALALLYLVVTCVPLLAIFMASRFAK